ncbi:hypothetical protein OF83DRAFT_1177015 [Amylostereum chailletii]|nr:hypothetical protein OF83DRAFT_1177015 [Amylostereum chailletii]
MPNATLKISAIALAVVVILALLASIAWLVQRRRARLQRRRCSFLPIQTPPQLPIQLPPQPSDARPLREVNEFPVRQQSRHPTDPQAHAAHGHRGHHRYEQSVRAPARAGAGYLLSTVRAATPLHCAKRATLLNMEKGDEYWMAAASQRLAAIDGCFTSRNKVAYPSHITEARQVVQDELAALQKATRLVGSRWNELTPICRLPQEVLAYIFHLHVIEAQNSENPEPYLFKLRGTDIHWVVQLTHVCRLWRHLALSLASIWTDVTFTAGVRWAREMLERSKTAPVNMKLEELTPCDWLDGPDPHRMYKRASLIPAHLHHIRSLNAWGCLCDVERVITSLVASAPVMEKLDIIVNKHSNALIGADRSIVLGPDFLSEDAPRLRFVRLRGCVVPWTSPLLTDLAYLELSLDHRYPAVSLSLGSTADLIQVLQSMPGLDSLKLENCFPRDLASHRTSTIINLPILTKLGVSGTVGECSALLRLLDTPSSTSLQIACRSMDATGNDCCIVLPALSAPLLRASQAGYQPQSLEISHVGSWLRVALSEELNVTGSARVGNPAFVVQFTWAQSPRKLHLPTIKKVLDSLADYMKSLRTIRVRGEAWRAKHWLAFFPNATQVLHVCGVGMAGWTLERAIAPTTRLFPQLHMMKLSKVNIMREPPGGDSFIDQLSDQLNARAEAGLAVEKLIISQCTVLRHMVTPLRDVVDVEYDYSQGELSEEDVDTDGEE